MSKKIPNPLSTGRRWETGGIEDVDAIGYITKKGVKTRHLLRGKGVVIDDGLPGPLQGANYITLIDQGGQPIRIEITAPQGGEGSNLPYLTMAPVRQRPCRQQPSLEVNAYVAKLLKVKDIEKGRNLLAKAHYGGLMAWHARLVHCDVNRIVATLRERNIPVSEKVRKEVWRACSLCEERNATYHMPKPVPDRRQKETQRYGELIYGDVGNIKGYPISVIAETHSRDIDVMALDMKRDTPDHYVRFIAENRSLLPPPHNHPKMFRSDNEALLKSIRMREVMPFIHFDKSAPYHSPSQGPAENAIKIIRSLTSTMLRVKNWPHELIPELVEGVMQTYRAVYSSEIGTSPHNKKHGSHQDLRFVCGDQVVFKPHAPKTVRKTADLPGRRGNYIRRESRQSVRVVEFGVEGVPFVMCSVHPVNVSVIRKGILSEWGYNGGDPASSPVLAGSTDRGREPEATEGEWIQHPQELEEIPVPSESEQEQEQTSGEESENDEGAEVMEQLHRMKQRAAMTSQQQAQAQNQGQA
uniref:Integrase catalytic domain-containing protein n=1 Tax=Chromera velia CCMP2878 TaxID=1169474 RepID=A0A0G4HWR8_9ALVE|eukprot:Cvel_9078.t1-p1 / transcript=Cvel_9078.t1 / gene=Cvel_9078 / organism=Chromera_velia_CCMP2878 / gene_product=hypothetical protein / transcript_product=hypothetical protein / location=Cvel_scaffold515:17027-18598(-) / protein_length=524 / sequence_SO=supercontig / SO=protein_coding / is_pseudo=false